MNPNDLRAAIRAASDEAQAVVESKSLSAAEKKSKVDELEARVKDYSAQLSVAEQAAALTAAGAANDIRTGGLDVDLSVFGGTKSIVRSGALQLAIGASPAEMKGLFEAARRKMPFKAEIGLKANSGDGLSASSIPTDAGFVQLQHEPQRILSLIPTTSTSSPVLEYVQQQANTGSAGMVAEGTAKPEIVVGAERVEVRVRKIAATAKVTNETLSDYPTFASWLTRELSHSLIDVESAQLLSGDGTGENLTGILATSGILTHAVATGDSLLDGIEAASTALRVGAAFTEPDSILLHPTTWSLLRTQKDSQNRYLVEQPVQGAPQPTSLWNIPVVTSTAVPVGEAVVANLQVAT